MNWCVKNMINIILHEYLNYFSVINNILIWKVYIVNIIVYLASLMIKSTCLCY